MKFNVNSKLFQFFVPENGTPLTHNFTEEIAYCQEELNSSEYQLTSFLDPSDEITGSRSLVNKISCPSGYKCKRLRGQTESVCCPIDLVSAGSNVQDEIDTAATERQQSSMKLINKKYFIENKFLLLTVCEYLRDFSDRMEGTEEGMSLAIKPPKCDSSGGFMPMQCQLIRMRVTKAEQKKVLEQNNVREMRKLLHNTRKRRDIETLKLVRVDNYQQQSRRSDEGVDTPTVIDYLKRKIFESPEKFISELFGAEPLQGRTARVIDIQAEDYDEDDFEGRDERKLALKSQNRHQNELVEVEVEQCFCVDRFGTEIPKTRGSMNVSYESCDDLRNSIDCLELTCRMGCDYGFVIDPETQCPTCQCRDPCDSVSCDDSQECRTVEVSCEDSYCPSVPVCFPKKQGQCPFLVPPAGEEESEDACAFECRSDNHCMGNKKCCSNGCGTVCVEVIFHAQLSVISAII